MIVTNSSIYYVQAKQGLPLGVLVVGWATLGKSQLMLVKSPLIHSSGIIGSPQSARIIPQRSLHPPTRSDVLAVRTNLHHPHHLLRRRLLLRFLPLPLQLDASRASSVPPHYQHPSRRAPTARIC